MDWAALMPQTAKAEQGSGLALDCKGESGAPDGAAPQQMFPLVPNSKSICSHSLANENNVVANVANVPTTKAGKPVAQGLKSSAGGGGGSPDFFASEKRKGNISYPLHPVAVVMVLAWCEQIEADDVDMAGALIDLRNYSPGEQVSRWHQACVDKGLQPWRLRAVPAAMEGRDCTMCAHLVSRTYPEANGRRLFHWGCGRGYLVLELGQGSERIWMAPPECKSWERWQPAAGPAVGGGAKCWGFGRVGPTG